MVCWVTSESSGELKRQGQEAERCVWMGKGPRDSLLWRQRTLPFQHSSFGEICVCSQLEGTLYHLCWHVLGSVGRMSIPSQTQMLKRSPMMWWCCGWWGHEGEGPDWHWCPYKRGLPGILVLCIMWPAVRRWYWDRESWYMRGIWEASSPDRHAGLWS